LDEASDEIRAAGGDVVCVFQYRAQPTRNFCRQRGVELECLGDPERASYQAVGLEEASLKEILGPQLAKGFLRAGRKGSLPGIPVGDTKQRPGTFVVAPDGTVAFAHYNADSGDHPSLDAMLDAIRGAAAKTA
jgi:peroxiredoxin